MTSLFERPMNLFTSQRNPANTPLVMLTCVAFFANPVVGEEITEIAPHQLPWLKDSRLNWRFLRTWSPARFTWPSMMRAFST